MFMIIFRGMFFTISLRPTQTKYSFNIIWRYNNNREMRKRKFYYGTNIRSMIQTKAKTYGAAAGLRLRDRTMGCSPI